MASGMMKSDTFPLSLHASADKSPTKVTVGQKEKTDRQCKEHSFLTDVADVRAMEQGLIQLLDDFHSGKLQAFGGSVSFEKMDQIREQQERLARLHFEMELIQDMQRRDTDDARTAADEKMTKLIDQLHSISGSIQKMQN